MKSITVKAVESGEDITCTFRRISNRKFEDAMDLLEEVPNLSRTERRANRKEAFAILMEESERLLQDASRADCSKALDAAITFNQLGDGEQKKSD